MEASWLWIALDLKQLDFLLFPKNESAVYLMGAVSVVLQVFQVVVKSSIFSVSYNPVVETLVDYFISNPRIIS